MNFKLRIAIEKFKFIAVYQFAWIFCCLLLKKKKNNILVRKIFFRLVWPMVWVLWREYIDLYSYLKIITFHYFERRFHIYGNSKKILYHIQDEFDRRLNIFSYLSQLVPMRFYEIDNVLMCGKDKVMQQWWIQISMMSVWISSKNIESTKNDEEKKFFHR